MLTALRTMTESMIASVTRYFSPPPMITVAGVQQTSARAEYSAEHALSSVAGYPWARVGIEAVAANLSQVPIRVLRDGRPDDAHWLHTLLRRPEPDWGGVRWRRQIVADLRGTGNAFALITRDSRGRPVRLRRQHPEGWEATVSEVGDIQYWTDATGRRHETADVWHVADISWRPGAAAKLGESPIRPLDAGIRASLAARGQARKASERGRLEMLVSSKLPLSKPQAEELSRALEDVRKQGGGQLVHGSELVVQPLSLLARDTEFVALDDRARVECGAVLGVPPVRRQDPSANYGAAKQEMRQYWENLQSLAALIDEELTELVGEPGVTVRHSFEAVEALQTSYTERLNRCVVWMQLGADPFEAAIYERFEAPPLTKGAAPRVDKPRVPADPSLQVDTPQAQSVQVEVARALADAATWLDSILAGEDPGMAVEPLTARVLAQRLRSGPLAPIADDVAETVLDAVAVAMDAGALDGGCATLPAFGTDHAAMLAGVLEAQ